MEQKDVVPPIASLTCCQCAVVAFDIRTNCSHVLKSRCDCEEASRPMKTDDSNFIGQCVSILKLITNKLSKKQYFLRLRPVRSGLC